MVQIIVASHAEATEHRGGQEAIRHLRGPQNASVHQKIQRILSGQVPIIPAGILEGRIMVGVIDTSCPLEVMKTVVTYLNTMLDDDILKPIPKQRTIKIQALLFLMRRILGARPGQLSSIQTMLRES